MYLDRKLIWTKYIRTERKAMDLKLCRMYWLVGRKSQLSLYNKLIIYKANIKPVWTYGIQLWGAACNSNLEFQLSNLPCDSMLYLIGNIH